VRATLSRHGLVYATSAATRSRGHTRLLLTAVRRLGAGHYTLALTSRHQRRRSTSLEQITIA
jgi:hypothetical protein